MTAPSSHVRPMLAQAVLQSSDTPWVVVVQGWLSSWLEHEGPRETGGLGEGGGGLGGGGGGGAGWQYVHRVVPVAGFTQ